MKTLASLVAGLALAGCAASFPDAPQVTPARIAAAPGPLVRIDPVYVQSFRQNGLSRTAAPGAACVLEGAGLEANFTTPALVRMPVYAGRTSDATITCRLGGRVQSRLLEAINLTAEAAEEGLRIETGNKGTSVELGISIRDRSKDRFDYPSSLPFIF